MKKQDTLIEDTDYLMLKLREEYAIVSEANAIDDIFKDLKKSLTNITMLPNNVIDATKYQEHEIVDVFRKMGFEYKKPMGKKLLFFNKKSNISIYLGQDTRRITLQP